MASTATDNQSEKTDESKFDCNICFETAKDAVISMCGHLFCWPCIHRWMEARPNNPLCPVCKSAIDKDRLIPIYGRSTGETRDPRDTVPPRPQGQREEREPVDEDNGFFGMGNGGGMNISFGFGGLGAFPLFGFGPAFTFQTGPQHFRRPPSHAHHRAPEEEQRQRMSRLMLTLALLFILMIIIS